MPYKNIREFIQALNGIGRIKHIVAEVDKDWELACIARWVTECTEDHRMCALHFENVKGYQTPVVVGLYSSYDLYAKALGIAPTDILSHWSNALKRPIKPTLVHSAPVKHVIQRGDDVNLLELPVPVWTPGRDAGPYISSASVITKDPETGVQNMGVYRVQIHSEKAAGLFFGTPRQHGAIHHAKYAKRNQPMPVAIVIGGSPAINFAAAAKTAYGVDELEIAGALAGSSIEVVRGESVDLLVPGEAEYVIEGFVPPDTRVMEGPFGEALGYMNLAAPAPVVEITALCRRSDPIFHGCLQQMPPSEGHIVWEMGVLGPLWFYLTEKLALTALRDLSVIQGSAGLAMLAVQLKLGRAHEARQLGRVLSKINFGQKYVLLFDEDIDIRDLKTLQWALSSRVDPARDIHIFTDTATYQPDPSVLATADRERQSPPYSSSMAVIDATLKCDGPEISLPGKSYMLRALGRLAELGLPLPRGQGRLNRLLSHHSENELHFRVPAVS